MKEIILSIKSVQKYKNFCDHVAKLEIDLDKKIQDALDYADIRIRNLNNKIEHSKCVLNEELGGMLKKAKQQSEQIDRHHYDLSSKKWKLELEIEDLVKLKKKLEKSLEKKQNKILKK
jgi:septal ring factor EnvC (AmiA/AmiB activator)